MLSGATGPSGLKGEECGVCEPGPKGETGAPGLIGLTGASGKDGLPGRHGTDGQKGASGLPGLNGREVLGHCHKFFILDRKYYYLLHNTSDLLWL